MNPVDLALHILSFAAPAFAVALAVAAVARFSIRQLPGSLGWWASVATNFIAGLGVSLAGLWYFGNDGKMATYAVLVAAVATAQWVGARGWRR